ncbi:hypothetical protein AB0H43_13925 [Hamadaea sp. NPDC050747]|uniref:hypothetical protein n=1 Tax=Hamadaea sp. NPDC050747 TaxID=3155789 RepID=UPI0033E941E3
METETANVVDNRVRSRKAHIVAMVTNRRVSDTASAFAKQQSIDIIDRLQLEKWATYGVSWLPTRSHVLTPTL